MTTETAPPAPPATRTRLIVFRVITGLVLLAFSPVLVGAVPWLAIDVQGDGVLEPWHDTVEGAVDAILVIAMIGLWLRPVSRPLLAQYLVLVCMIAASVIPAAGPSMFITLGLILLAVASFPRPTLLLDTRMPFSNRPLLVVTVLAAAVLTPLAITSWSPTDADADAAAYAEHLMVLGMAGVLAATTRAGWRWLAGPTAVVWTYLGIVAISFPDATDSFGTTGGIALIIVGAAIAIASTGRLAAQPVRRTQPQPATVGPQPEADVAPA